MSVNPSINSNYYQYDVGAGELVTTEVKTLTNFPGSTYFNVTPWFIYISQFYINNFNDTRWKPIVGSMYTTAGTNSWGIWISPSPDNLIHWRVGDYTENTNIAVSNSDWRQLIVAFTGSNLNIKVRNHNTLSLIESYSVTNSNLWTSIVTTGVVTSGGWENNAAERFPGHIVGITFGKYPTSSLIGNVISSPIANGLATNISTSGIGFATSRTNTLVSWNTNVASITGSADSWVLTTKAVGTASIQSNVVDSTGFFPPVNSSVTLTVSRTAATLSVSQSTIVVKYVLGSTFSFNVFGTNNTDTPTRTFSSGSSVTTIPNSSIATAQIAGVGSSLISVTQAETTNFTSISSPNILTLVIVGQGGTYSAINMTSLDLSGTNLSSTIFSNTCNLTGANLYGTTVNEFTNLSTATLTNVKSGRILGITALLPSGYKII